MDNTTYPNSDETLSSNGNGMGNSTLNKAKEQISPLVQQAQEKASGMMGQAKGQIVSQLAEKKVVATEGLSNISLALRQASLSLQGQNQEKVGQYAETAADQLERFGSYLEEQDVDQILDSVQDYARRNPALILGSTFALGFLAARFLKNAGTESNPAHLPMRVEDTSPMNEGVGTSFTDAPDLSSPTDLSLGSPLDDASGVSGSSGAFSDTELSGLSSRSGATGEGLGNDV